MPRILIVDDEKGLRLGTSRLLTAEGYEVDTAENGTEGIKLGTTNDYDLAVIDMKMPDIDGIDVLKAIKEKRPNTICFIATAYASYETAIEATRLGAASYIPKPFTPEELIKQLESGYEKRLLLLEAEKLKREREERMLEVAFEKTRLNTIVNSIVDGVIVVNKSGELVLFNSAALKYYHLSNSMIGENILTFIHPKISELVNNFFTSEEYLDKSFSEQIELKPDRELVVDVTCSPVPQVDKSLAGVVIVITNITELKKIEHIKSQFVSMVAHELKTPIAAVLGFLKIIIDPEFKLSPEQQKDYLTRSEKRLVTLVDMVNDLLDISRMEIGTKRREIKEIDLAEIIKSNTDFLELELKKRNLTLNLDLPDGLPLLKADYNEISRLFTNIIGNSVKYNRDNGSIDIKIKFENGNLITSISDTGIGMKPEEKNRLFQEFFRAKNESTRNIPGTGLGLSIVKRIAESYSGNITVESEYGKGSTFTVIFPLKQSQ